MSENYSYYQREKEPEKPKKKKKGKVIAVVLCALLMLGLVGGGSYAAFSHARDYLDEKYADKNAESNDASASAGKDAVQAGLTTAGSGEISATNTGSVVMMDVSDVVKETKPSVVQVTNRILYTMNYFGQQASQESSGSGSGVIVGENDTELLVVTNYHVVNPGSENSGMYTATSEGIDVQFIDGTTVTATVKGVDESSDLAVLAVPLSQIEQETKDQIRIATVGDSDALMEGEGVVAIGNALGYGLSVTVGYVSALNREITINGNTNQFIQTDAAINPGNSGGGLFNTKGELIGINDAKTVDESVEGVGYAIPISSVKDIITELMNAVPRVAYGDEEKGYLGISGQDIDENTMNAYNLPSGVWVYYIQEGSAAEKAGIQERDIITAIGDKQVKSYDVLREEISYYAAGDQVDITLERVVNGSYQEMTITVTLGSYAEEAPEGGTIPAEEAR